MEARRPENCMGATSKWAGAPQITGDPVASNRDAHFRLSATADAVFLSRVCPSAERPAISPAINR